jgi:hypothetical protein
MNFINWHDLQVNHKYYVITTGFLGDNTAKYVKIINILYLPNDEAMILTDYNGYGFAVGGKFEGIIGPRNKFYLVNENYMNELNCAVAA